MAEDKAKKYDRQLRIWGQHGQAALEKAQICLLNCGATGSEALKNLVLGGIYAFTVVDDARVSPSDLGSNFMVEKESLGQTRAKCVCALLQELNDSVTGSFVEERPETLINQNPGFFDSFTLVIATQLHEAIALKLDALLRQKGIPLLLARSYGLVGYLRVSVEEHTVIETKPENRLEDLRLNAPWPELQHFASKFNFNSMDDAAHKHVPWGVILIQAADMWRSSHGGDLPKLGEERKQFKATVAELRRHYDEENFDQALANVSKVWSVPVVSSELSALLNDPKAVELDKASSDFWVLVAALKEFVQNAQGCLPLNGSLPDMVSDTESFVEMQAIYRKKAMEDAASVGELAARICKQVGRTQTTGDATSDPEKVRLFCRNAPFVQVVRTRSLEAECSGGSCKSELLQSMMTREDTSVNTTLYMLLRAADHVFADFGNFPGTFESHLDEDVARLKQVASALLADCGTTHAVLPDDLVGEMVRFGASELHCVGAIMGGMAAQEAIKLITAQFVPLSGGLIYNGMTSTTTPISL